MENLPQDHSRRFSGKAERLRRPERLAMLEVPRVTGELMRGFTRPRVLDIGTGSALFAEAFLEAGAASVTGVDANPEMVAAARAALPGSDFFEAEAEHLPFAGNSFDLCFMGHVLHEVSDLKAALSGARRVCGGQRLGALEWPYREETQGPPLQARLTEAQVKAAAESAGWGTFRTLALQHMVLYIFEG